MAALKGLLLDIGGVLLTNGWDTSSRKLAAEYFHISFEEFEKRHRQTFPIFEMGHCTLEHYLIKTLFDEARSFTMDQFKEFMFSVSKPLPNAIDIFIEMKQQNGLKVFALNNEGLELNEHRIKAFQLNRLFDAYISSCYVHMIKPDPLIYTLAKHVTGFDDDELLYIDDRELFVKAAKDAGIDAIHHISIESTMHEIKLRL